MAETKVVAHVDISLLPTKRGEWTDADGTGVTLALDAKGGKPSINSTEEVRPFSHVHSARTDTWTLSRHRKANG